ncbi:MAG: DUF59 domain-containing protein [Anaerolineaceae bacterium]|nr:DUF59 domain-containing protein [Anaerolineaceae bacterium]
MTEDPKPLPLRWNIEDSNSDLIAPLKHALRTVKDPELDLDILQLGLVRDVSIIDDAIIIKMILTTPFCPYGPSLLESTRTSVESALNRTTRIDFSLEPWDIGMMEEGASDQLGFF